MDLFLVLDNLLILRPREGTYEHYHIVPFVANQAIQEATKYRRRYPLDPALPESVHHLRMFCEKVRQNAYTAVQLIIKRILRIPTELK